MKTLIALLPVLFLSQSFAADAPEAATAAHRYLIERTFPPGALNGLNAAGKAKINATNAQYGVRWVTSYANASKTKTYCIYEAPSEAAVREAAKANAIPVDTVTEVPVTLSPN
jgi:Protein of unknown function (DUF4242)